MKNLTAQQLIGKGGKEWIKGDIHRVYLSQDLFNEATGQQVSLNEKKWKFYVDAKTGEFFRSNGKNPVLAR